MGSEILVLKMLSPPSKDLTRLSTVSIENNLTGIRIFAALQSVTIRIKRFGTDSTDSTVWNGLGRIQVNLETGQQANMP